MLGQGVGLWELRSSLERWTDFSSELARLGPSRVVTAVWAIPQVGALSVGTVDLRGVVTEEELDQLVDDGAAFWWLSTPGGFGETRPLALRSELPCDRFEKLDERDFSRFGLDATLYRATRYSGLR